MCVLMPGEVGVCAVTAAGCAAVWLQLQCSCAAVPDLSAPQLWAACLTSHSEVK